MPIIQIGPVLGRIICIIQSPVRNSHLLVPDVLKGIGNDGNTHIDEIRGSHLKNLLRKLLAILVDFLKEEHTMMQVDTTQK